jgi:hypothetical protein
MYVFSLLPEWCLQAAYLRGIREIIVLAFFLVFLGVVYQVSQLQTPNLKVLMDSYPEVWLLSELLVSRLI